MFLIKQKKTELRKQIKNKETLVQFRFIDKKVSVIPGKIQVIYNSIKFTFHSKKLRIQMHFILH